MSASRGRSSRNIPWLRIGAEAVAIVVSILIAFALDAWWDVLAERKQERASLAAVREDLRSARDELQTVLEWNDGHAATVTALLAEDPEAFAGISADSAETLLIPAVLGGLTFDPSTGALQALLAGGALDRVTDGALAAALAGWPGLMDEIEEDQMFLVETWGDLRDWLRDRALLSSTLPLFELPPVRGSVPYTEVLVALLRDSGGRERLAAQLASLVGLSAELDVVDARLRDLLAQLDTSLE